MSAIAKVAAGLWAVTSFAVLVLTYGDISGARLVDARLWSTLISFSTTSETGQLLGLTALVALVVAFGAVAMNRPGGAGVLLVVSQAGLWPIALSGHASGSANHDVAVNAQMIHIVGTSVWVGSLIVLVATRRVLGDDLAAVVGRYSTIAAWCFVAVALSGMAEAWVRVGSWSALSSDYGRVIIAKVCALVVLAGAGLIHRRRTISQIEGGRGSAFRRLATAEVVVMASAMGLGVALSRMSPPVDTSSPALSRGDSLLNYTLPGPVDGFRLITEWRIDTLWFPVAAVAVGWYVWSAAKLRRRGDSWAIGRSAAWVAGWLLVTWATSGSPGVYGKALFSMHMVQHMTIATAAPALLVLGAPITLLLRTSPARKDGSLGPREWALRAIGSRVGRLVSHPLFAAAAFVVSLAAFYYTGVFEASLRSHTAHQLMVMHFLITGYLFASGVVGVDPAHVRLPHPMRLVVIMVVFGYHALFSVSLMASTTLLAQDWFELVSPPWVESLGDDQYRGASIGWALGDLPLGVLAVALIGQWVRADHAEQRRFDRKADRDGDAELSEYNDYLRRIAEHRAAQQPFGRGR